MFQTRPRNEIHGESNAIRALRCIALCAAVALATPSMRAQSCRHAWDAAIGDPANGGGLYAYSQMSGEILSVAAFDDGSGPAVYAGGFFFEAGGTNIGGGIARWNGSTWSDVGGGVSSNAAAFVSSMLVFDDGSGPALYAGGQFDTAGSTPAISIARWDGSTWSPLGGGPCNGGCGGAVNALVAFDDGAGQALYAGGSFSANGNPNHIAMWDGNTWQSLGGGVSYSGGSGWPAVVRALAVFDDGTGTALYAGGHFDLAGGRNVSYGIAKWNGTNWSSVGSGMNEIVHALTVYDDGNGPALYAGGSFTAAGGQSADYIARWDGVAWSAVGGGMNGDVYALDVFAGPTGDLVAGGGFTGAGGTSVNHVARWNGRQWSDVGGGVSGAFSGSPAVFALAGVSEVSDVGPALYAAGIFRYAGGTDSLRIASWTANTFGGADSDGDGLYDYWETCGIDPNQDGVVDLIVGTAAFTPDPLHKDIFVEIDSMYGHSPGNGLSHVRNALGAAPVSNPDGVSGINLQFYIDEHFTHADATYDWNEFDTLKDRYFGAASARSQSNWIHIREAWKRVYHYCLYVDQFYRDTGQRDPNTGAIVWDDALGSAEGRPGIGGNDMVISSGALDGSVWQEEAGVFLHELGHNLGLGHGGGDRINRKPNYKSVMNYTWTTPAGYGGIWRPDYSSRRQRALNEAALDETRNMDGDSGDIVVYGPAMNGNDYATSGATAPVDWNQDGSNSAAVSANINAFFENSGSPSSELLVGHNDWANLVYNFRESVDYGDYSHVTAPIFEINRQVVAAQRGGTPTGTTYRDDDGSREDAASIDYNDDFMEKTIEFSMGPAAVETATLWIFGQPYNYAGHAFQRREDYRIRVNDDPSQVISFDVGLVFSDQTLIYQWVRFDIPTSWLVQGPNRIFIHEESPSGAWDHNNLRVGIDTGNDFDRSWWYGNGRGSLGNPAACDGELMIFLEIEERDRRGDLNCDGAFNGADIDPFFLALGDPAAYAIAFPNCDALLADMNGDGSVNGADIDPFFACLGGGGCP